MSDSPTPPAEEPMDELTERLIVTFANRWIDVRDWSVANVPKYRDSAEKKAESARAELRFRIRSLCDEAFRRGRNASQ